MLVENALALAALELPGTSSLVIELGVALDLMLVALVAAVFHERIFAEFGAGDTAELRTLRRLTAAARARRRRPARSRGCAARAGTAPAREPPRRSLARPRSGRRAGAGGLGARRSGRAGDVDRRRRGGRTSRCCDRPRRTRVLLRRPARTLPGSLVQENRDRTYYVVLYAFWSILLAVPLAGNLGAAWLLVEATTATSAILVGFSGKPRALEAAWYLILTSLGLGVALLGIVLLAAGVPTGGLDGLTWGELSRYDGGRDTALAAYLLLLAGLAAKIGCPCTTGCPTHAGAPVSALLSGALLPAVLLVAWRSTDALAPVVGTGTAERPARLRDRLARRRGPPSSGARSPGSGCSPTPASSTWA